MSGRVDAGWVAVAIGAIFFIAIVAGGSWSAAAATPEWNPKAWAAQSTLELQTDDPGEGPYWFPVWLVVLDGQVYVRLGTRAANRVQKSQGAPYLSVRVAGQEFSHVKGVAVPEMADEVAAAMADKYWSDILVRFFSHPVTLRLEPSPPSAPAG